MNKLKIVILLIIAVIVVVVTGVVATRVGGITIRSASRVHEEGGLTVASAALLPGVPVVARLGATAALPVDRAMLLMRMSDRTVTISEISAEDVVVGTFTIVIPCDITLAGERRDDRVRLVLVDGATQALLVSSDLLALLPPGPDCLYSS